MLFLNIRIECSRKRTRLHHNTNIRTVGQVELLSENGFVKRFKRNGVAVRRKSKKSNTTFEREFSEIQVRIDSIDHIKS
jgi:hypothetical protein